MPPEAIELLVLAAAALMFAIVFSPPTAGRRVLLVRGGAGLAASVLIVAMPTFDLALLVVLALGELLDDLGAEGLEIVGLAARHESVVDDDLLVDPLGLE